MERTFSIRDLVDESYNTAFSKGWHDEGKNKTFTECIALFHSEISEALEEYRNGRTVQEIYLSENGKPEGVPVELADLLIRVFDTCGELNIPIQKALELKLNYNKSRPYRHGNKVV